MYGNNLNLIQKEENKEFKIPIKDGDDYFPVAQSNHHGESARFMKII